MNDSRNRYYVKNTEEGSFTDITSMFDGLAILKIDGMVGHGKPVNIYTAQWVNSQTEDFMITTLDDNENPIVIRENMDISITFIVRKKYAATPNSFNAISVHDSFIGYMTGSDIWVKSSYIGNKQAHCVCVAEYKPTVVKLNRGDNSYIMGTITLHCLDAVS